MKKSNLLGWASNILNVLVFIVLLINTRQECIELNSVISSVIMMGISIIIQIINSTIEEE